MVGVHSVASAVEVALLDSDGVIVAVNPAWEEYDPSSGKTTLSVELCALGDKYLAVSHTPGESLTTTITARKDLVPGPGLKPETIEGARVYVLPNPSGLNNSCPSFASKLPWFEALQKVANG